MKTTSHDLQRPMSLSPHMMYGSIWFKFCDWLCYYRMYGRLSDNSWMVRWLDVLSTVGESNNSWRMLKVRYCSDDIRKYQEQTAVSSGCSRGHHLTLTVRFGDPAMDMREWDSPFVRSRDSEPLEGKPFWSIRDHLLRSSKQLTQPSISISDQKWWSMVNNDG